MERQALLPENDERRLRDPPHLRLAEIRRQPAREVDLEGGRRVRQGLVERAWNHAVEALPVRRPAEPEELVDGDTCTDVAVPRNRLLEPATIEIGAVADEQARLEQRERPDELRRVERELQRDEPTERVADDVRAWHAGVRQDCAAIGRVLPERHRRGRRTAPAVAPAVIRDQPMVGERRLREQRPERGCDERAVDEEQGLAGFRVVIRERDVTFGDRVH